jgi:polar amino acid transport system substrate-binding protein
MNQPPHKTVISLASIALLTSVISLYESFSSTTEHNSLFLLIACLHIFVLITLSLFLTKISINTLFKSHDIAELNKLSLDLTQQKFALDQHSIVAITDIKGTITYVNDKFIQISEYNKKELIGNNHRILNSDFHPADFFRDMYLTISSGKVWQGEIQNRSKFDKIYWVDTTIVPFKNDAGNVSSYIAIRTDITQRKKDADDLLAAKEIAESAALAKSEFLANMSHEIRTPMNGILGMLTLLEKAELQDQQKKQLGLAQNSAHSLLTIINDILDFSKIDAGKLEIEHIDFDLRKLIDDFAESQALKANEKNLELIVDTSQIPFDYVKSDPIRLQQILTNLVGNSFKFTNEGEVIIKAAIHDSGDFGLTLYCSVTDTGIGIPKEKQSDLFDVFTQADASTTRQYGGTGLGLSISKHLCELMGGSISLNSQEGSGSSFYFSIQVDKSERQNPVLPTNDISELCILIADENESIRQSISSQLTLWGATTLTASHADEAMNKIQTSYLPGGSPVDIVLTDLDLPGMTGIELMKNIHELYDNKICLALMTKMSYHMDMTLISDTGFQFHIPKPATTAELLKLLTAHTNPNYKNGVILEDKHICVTTENPPLKQIKNVLLVEDNFINQEVAKSLLDDLNCQTCIANNGLEALDILRADPSKFDVILMDCQMPELDGYETTKAIRRSEAGETIKDITIIAMTANALKGDREKCLEAGMDDYISKPVDPTLLKDKLSL